jgi:hypothetical protein
MSRLLFRDMQGGSLDVRSVMIEMEFFCCTAKQYNGKASDSFRRVLMNR